VNKAKVGAAKQKQHALQIRSTWVSDGTQNTRLVV